MEFHHIDNDGVADATRTIAAVFQTDGTNASRDGTDYAILRLNAAAPAGVFPARFGLSNPVGVTARVAGFGANGLGSTGSGGTSDGLRWGADNVLDAYGAERTAGGVATAGTANLFNFDFDDGTPGNNTLSPGVASSATPLTNEGSGAPGDSGGPMFVNNELVAVTTGGTSGDPQFGVINHYTGTLLHRAFTQTNVFGAIFGDEFTMPSDG
ncbi:MAG: trypsin-like serine protease, partial [Pirellulaceae bacterium]|nr:trypsin-like serine protease [Pirellulaceae bacterium]